MNTNGLDKDILAGSRIKLMRERLLMSSKAFSKATGIPVTTINRIENGIESYDVHKLTPICNFFGINREDLYKSDFEIPEWRALISKMKKLHKPGSNPYTYIFTKTPKLPMVIEQILLKEDVLDDYVQVKDVMKFLSEKCNWEYLSSSITNALNKFVENGEIESKQVSSSLFKYRRKR
ncbi:helix-turn-helix domain-containing protein [Belliella sp. R4-6]|uniref:Helix-turn-helix domain-containing protein n=1 Tax=Belliella alkalica TaxID=1730871 RepID=A0ABS9VDM1_9BACT|nr:helix-turn-helix transcriptional regulator [Belliella alkalica]MCH7414324.1 helix-turn-helix domain-containing protein [Belliella alkalica]